MSMIVETKIKGIADLSQLIEALTVMGIEAFTISGNKKIQGKNIIGRFYYKGRKLDICKNDKQELMMVGDSDWKVMEDSKFLEKVLQQYGVSLIKKKIRALKYTIASEKVLANGSIQIKARAWG